MNAVINICAVSLVRANTCNLHVYITGLDWQLVTAVCLYPALVWFPDSHIRLRRYTAHPCDATTSTHHQSELRMCRYFKLCQTHNRQSTIPRSKSSISTIYCSQHGTGALGQYGKYRLCRSRTVYVKYYIPDNNLCKTNWFGYFYS